MSMQRLQGKVAIVTGAASGFGAGIARVYAREGAKVVVADINEAGASGVAKEIGAAAAALRCDVSKRADIDGAVALARDRFGKLDIVVNNAGTTHDNQPLLDVDEATFDLVYAVNVKSIYHMVMAAVPVLRKQGTGGVILNVGSTAGIRPRPGLTWYNSSKGAVNLMSKSLAVELAPDRIRVNVICPVAGETPLLARFMGADTPENRARFLATIPLGRFSRPDDIANAAVFLASDEAEFITGVEFPVDGGRTV
jgi:3-oxoacyl-[acyl-carrier protein] reductase